MPRLILEPQHTFDYIDLPNPYKTIRGRATRVNQYSIDRQKRLIKEARELPKNFIKARSRALFHLKRIPFYVLLAYLIPLSLAWELGYLLRHRK